MIKITQDGVQLDPETFEIRAGYDQLATTLNVVCNTKWSATSDGSSGCAYARASMRYATARPRQVANSCSAVSRTAR